MSYGESFEKLKEIYAMPEISSHSETFLKNVSLFREVEPVPKTPMLCKEGIVIIGQGQKTGYLNGKEFRYDADNYLIVSVPTAFECETDATKENPLLGLFIEIDISRLHTTIEKIESHSQQYTFKGSDIFCGLEPIAMDDGMKQATEKLLNCLQSPMDSAVLGQSIVDEIIYRVLLGNHGTALVALTKQDSHYARISRTLSYIHTHYMKTISIDDLAQQANMSSSLYYRAFKFVTGESPLQYLKKIRLNKARFMIAREGTGVSVAADQVGYESLSQFSREFKRYFHVPPSAVKDAVYI